MQLTLKIVIYLFLFFLSIQNTFSQDKAIVTQFNQDGALYKNLEDFSEPLAEFIEDENCIIISYLGNYTYKIKYKEWEGFVKDEYLIINEQMMDLFFAHEKKQRNNAIQKRELRQKKIQQIVNSNLDSINKIKAQEKKRLETIQKAKLEQQRINESRRLDSIANVKALEKKRLEDLQKAKLEQQRINESRRLDSIANVKAQEKKQLEAIQKAKLEQQRINESKRLDSIAKIKAQEKKRLEDLQKAKLEQQRINESRRLDSIAEIKALEKKRLAAIQKAKLEQQRINENRRFDSIAKVKAQEKKRLENLQKAKLEQQRINESRRLDSIAKIKALEKKRLAAIQKAKLEQQRINENRRFDSIAKVKAQEKKRLETLQKARLEQQQINENRRLDSIANVKTQSQDANSLEKIKSRNTCNYLINEYDNYYKQHIIITDKYTINEDLNIELIREGNTSKIHINTREDLGCASYVPNTRSSVTITLENDQVIKLYHSGSLDCNDFSLKAILSESKITTLKNSPIKSLTFRGTKRSLTISDIDYKAFFIDKLKCIE